MIGRSPYPVSLIPPVAGLGPMQEDAAVPASSVDPVLITGCSSGIGEATARRLARSGHLVYATARRPETLAGLVTAGCRALALDVTDEQSMVAAVGQIQDEHGRVGALVNNAGYGEYGPVEEVPIDAVRRQFETNVFGLVRLTQLVLPGMRAAGAGRIVNVSSMGGRIVFPVAGSTTPASGRWRRSRTRCATRPSRSGSGPW